jgi:hypothetical protein
MVGITLHSIWLSHLKQIFNNVNYNSTDTTSNTLWFDGLRQYSQWYSLWWALCSSDWLFFLFLRRRSSSLSSGVFNFEYYNVEAVADCTILVNWSYYFRQLSRKHTSVRLKIFLPLWLVVFESLLLIWESSTIAIGFSETQDDDCTA